MAVSRRKTKEVEEGEGAVMVKRRLKVTSLIVSTGFDVWYMVYDSFFLACSQRYE